MVGYALITLSPLAFVKKVDAVTATKPGYAIVPIVRLGDPAYNPATHKLEQRETVTESQVTREWVAVALTQSEIDAASKQTAHETSREHLASWLASLDGGTATTAQMRRMIAWVIRESTGLR